MRDLNQALEFDQNEQLPTWDAKAPGDQITGTLVGTKQIMTKYGLADLAVIERDDTEERVQVFLTPKVLQNLWIREAPEPGNRVGIRFLGIPAGKTWRNFSLVVDRETGGFPYAETCGLNSNPFTD
jgi:hypothetical protein